MNEQYAMPPMPAGSRDGILKGMYLLQAATNPKAKLKAQLFGSGAILNEVVAAQKILEKYDVAADVWSVTSYQELYRDGHACDRWNMLHPLETPRVPYVAQCLKGAPGVLVAASDYLKVLPDSIDQWMPRRMRSLGTDGFGRSEDRQRLREFFEVDSRFVALATLAELAQDGQLDRKVIAQAMKDLEINPEKLNPAKS
jgi:pyruvate dehydrogenase E1 component